MFKSIAYIDIKNDGVKKITPWAVNFFEHHDLMDILCFIKKYRMKNFHIVLNSTAHKEISEFLHFNSKGDPVFTWNSRTEKDFFISKWSSTSCECEHNTILNT